MENGDSPSACHNDGSAVRSARCRGQGGNSPPPAASALAAQVSAGLPRVPRASAVTPSDLPAGLALRSSRFMPGVSSLCSDSPECSLVVIIGAIGFGMFCVSFALWG